MKSEPIEVRVLPKQEPRIESGTVQFGADWPGVWIRGDHAFHYRLALLALLEGTANELDRLACMSLLQMLIESDQREINSRGIKPYE